MEFQRRCPIRTKARKRGISKSPQINERTTSGQTALLTLNDGDSVKVSFPIQNIIDVEESPMAEFAETVKIRVVDSEDTYAIDEVCPS